jgi:hypothetical protein
MATINDAVREMYLTQTGRAADPGGLEYFANRFGTSIEPDELAIFRQMAADEVAGQEARQAAAAAQQQQAAAATTTSAGTGMSIADVYQQVLGRAPDAAGLKYFSDRFGTSVDPTELSTFSVMAQPELAARPTTNDAVRQMYLSVLGREPDASGLKYFSDRFGADVDASELGIFRGMSTQEINANAARNAGTTAGTTAGTVQPIVRPPPFRQVTGTQLAPASFAQTAITGTPFTNLYTPSNVQQNAPRLSDIQAATQSANPYQSLMALTPQRTLSPSYAAQAGQTTANTNLGGFNPAIYNPAAATGLLTTPGAGVGGGGVNNSGDQRGAGNDSDGTGQTFYGGLANLAAEAQRAGFNTLGGFLASGIPVGAAYTGGNFNTAGLAALGSPSAIAAMNSQNQRAVQDAEQQSSSSPFDGGGTGLGLGAAYDKFEGGLITPRNIRGPNPPGPDDGNTNIDIGEYVIRSSAVKKYGANIFEQINAGKIPAKRLKSLLE